MPAKILRLVVFGLSSAMVSSATGFAVAGCGMSTSADRWSTEDRAQIERFRASLKFSDEATTVNNAQVSGNLSRSALESMVRSTQQALDAAQSVTDAVLDKIHPELRLHYRDDFQRGLELRIAAYDELSRGVLNVNGQIKWQAALHRWGNWYETKRRDLQKAIAR